MNHSLPGGESLHFWSHRTSAGHKVTGWHSEPSGRPVLHFIHGNGYNALVYEPMLDRLAAHFDLFLSDCQGHGESDDNGPFLGWNRTGELCLEAWQAHRDRFPADVPIYGCGHSFGGILTSLLMAEHSGVFDRSVILDPVLFTPAMVRVMAVGTGLGLWHRNAMATKTRRKRQQWPSREAAYQALEGRGMFRGWDEQALWAYVNHALSDDGEGVRLKCPPRLEAEIFSSFPRRLWRSIERIEQPVHVVYGEDSYDFVRASVPRWARRNARVSTETLPGGHCFMQQSPQRAAQAVIGNLVPEQSG